MTVRKFRVLNLLHPASFFVSYYVIFLVIGLGIIVLWGDPFGYYLNAKTYVIIFLYLLTFIVFSIASPVIELKPPKRIAQLTILNVHGWKITGIIFWILGALAYIVYYVKAKTVVVLTEDIETVRVTVKVGIGKFIIIGDAFFTVSLCFLYAMIARVKVGKKFKYLTYILTLLACLFAIGMGFRAPFAYLVLTIFLVRYFVSSEYESKNKIPSRYILFGVVFFLLLVFWGHLRYRGSIEASISTIVFLWGFFVQVLNLDTIVQAFPISHEYLYGASFIDDLLVVIGMHPAFLGVWLKDILSLPFKGEGMTVTAPGEAYVNFGIIGVLVHAMLLGLLSGLIYEKLSTRKDIASRVVLLLFSINIARATTAGVTLALFLFLGPKVVLAYVFLFMSKYIDLPIKKGL